MQGVELSASQRVLAQNRDYAQNPQAKANRQRKLAKEWFRQLSTYCFGKPTPKQGDNFRASPCSDAMYLSAFRKKFGTV